MTLSELKPRGYHLSDVEPDFRGMPRFEWWHKMITSQCDAFLESPKAKHWGDGPGKKWRERAVVTPTSRDKYGIRSM